MMKKKILIVDDKIEIAKVLMVYLSAEYEVFYLESAIHAISWLKEGNRPNLIISDINMPDMDGDEFLTYLKNDELFKLIPVMMLSSIEETEKRIGFLEKGADEYIIKPFNPQELKVRIKKLVS